MQKYEVIPLSHIILKEQDPKQIKDVSISPKTIKFLEENTFTTSYLAMFFDIYQGYKHPKKTKIRCYQKNKTKLLYIKIKKLANHISDKVQISRIYKKIYHSKPN